VDTPNLKKKEREVKLIKVLGIDLLEVLALESLTELPINGSNVP
jgi:hypothetical protein